MTDQVSSIMAEQAPIGSETGQHSRRLAVGDSTGVRRLDGRMSIGTVERKLTESLDVPWAEIIVRNSRTKRDIRDNAKLSALRRKA